MKVWAWNKSQYYRDENLSLQEELDFNVKDYFESQGYKFFGETNPFTEDDACEYGIFMCEKAREEGYKEFVVVTPAWEDDGTQLWVK